MPPLQCERIFRSPGIENLDELLSGRIIVPGAVLPHDLKQMIHGFTPLAFRVKRDGELEPGIPIPRIGGDSLFQTFDIRFRPRLLREVQRRLCAAIALRSLLRGWNQSERLLRSIQIPGLNIAFRKPPDCVRILRIGLQNCRELRRCACNVARGERRLRLFDASLAARIRRPSRAR